MTTGMFYTFVTYLEVIEKEVKEYADQPVIFSVEDKGFFTVETVNRDYGDKSVWFGIDYVNETNLKGLTLSELIMKAKVFQEECFDFIPVLAKFESIPENTMIRKDFPLIEVSVGITEDKQFYIFMVKAIKNSNVEKIE